MPTYTALPALAAALIALDVVTVELALDGSGGLSARYIKSTRALYTAPSATDASTLSLVGAVIPFDYSDAITGRLVFDVLAGTLTFDACTHWPKVGVPIDAAPLAICPPYIPPPPALTDAQKAAARDAVADLYGVPTSWLATAIDTERALLGL